MGSFRHEADAAAREWKRTTEALPDEARGIGLFGKTRETDLCLPQGHAAFNLLEPLCSLMIQRFTHAGIPWHGGGPERPGNHLLSSQIQCVNALGPFIDDPGPLGQIFKSVLPIEKVLPFEESSFPLDHVVFEWTGRSDYLGEWGRRKSSRGANATSADAAIRYKTRDGTVEIALIEWKYVETYNARPFRDGSGALATRLSRYEDRFNATDSPFKGDGDEVEALFVDPVYQLLRLHLLAREMEKASEGDATTVRVVYAAPARNLAIWKAMNEALATSDRTAVSAVAAWQGLLKRPETFAYLDTALLVRPDSPASIEFKERYAHLGNDY